MKNIISAIVFLFLVINANAQVVFSVKVDSFYNFKFKTGMRASDAFNNNDYIELMGNVGETVIIVNEPARTITMKFEGKTFVLDMIGHPNGNKSAYLYEYYEGEKLVQGQMSFVVGDKGGRYMIAECEDDTNPSYQKASMAKIK
jgi:hypothetical protein